MAEPILEKLLEHNNWANQQIIQVCSSLRDEQLDAQPQSVTKGSIRSTLFHLVNSQKAYLRLLTLPLEARLDRAATPPFEELQESASLSGNALLALARGGLSLEGQGRIQTKDGTLVERWVIMVQIINHADEHREQIKSMLSSMGVIPPEMDGWTFAEVVKAIVPVEEKK